MTPADKPPVEVSSSSSSLDLVVVVANTDMDELIDSKFVLAANLVVVVVVDRDSDDDDCWGVEDDVAGFDEAWLVVIVVTTEAETEDVCSDETKEVIGEVIEEAGGDVIGEVTVEVGIVVVAVDDKMVVAMLLDEDEIRIVASVATFA